MPGKPFHMSAMMFTITPPCSFIHAVYTAFRQNSKQSHGALKQMLWTRVTSLRLTGLAAVKRSSQVGVDHSFPSFGGHVLRWAAELTSTIVYQKVYPAMLLQHRWHEGFYLPHREPKQDSTVKWAYYEMVLGADSVGIPTSFSFLMLHWREVTEAGLDVGIFCLISWAAASSLPVFLLEITTLQPKGKP